MAFNASAWSETCLISITRKGGSEIQFAAMTETVDIDQGDKDIDQVVVLSGGRLVKKIPQDITTITFEGYPIGIGDDSTSPAKGISQYFHGQTTYDSTEPLAVSSTRTRELFRIAILWTDDATATTAGTGTAATKNAYRYIVANAWLTSMKPTFTDGILKITFSFKTPAFNKQGTSQIQEQSTEGTTVLAALNTYNTTNFPEDGTTFTW